MKKIVSYLCCFLALTFFFPRHVIAYMTYEIYVEDWEYAACVGVNSCSSCWPTCKFAWNNNTICTIAFASYGYLTSNPNAGVLYGLSQPASVLQTTAGLVHSAGGKIKMAYGGATGAYQLWSISGWQTPSVLYAIAQNIASACVGYGLDGVDLDFEDGPPTGAGAALATLIKNLRNLLGPNKIITITIPAQVIGGTPTNTTSDPTARTWDNFPEFHALLDNLSTSSGQIDFTLINHINFMEYCFGIAAGKTMVQQAISDIQSYNTGFYQIPYSKMALGLQQYCCAVTSCSAGESAMDPTTAANLATWANNTGLAGVFFWDLTKELEYYTPNLCTIPSAQPQAFPVSYAIRYVCGLAPTPPQVNEPILSLPILTSNTDPPLGFNFIGRQNSVEGQPNTATIPQP